MKCWSCFLDKLKEKDREEWLDFIDLFPEVDFDVCEACLIDIEED